MTTSTFDIADDAPATFAAYGWVKSDKVDDGPEVPEGDLDENAGALWANNVGKALRQINEVLQGEKSAPGLTSGPQTVYEVDFSGLDAADFVTGGNDDYAIDGKTWTIDDTAQIGTMELDGSNGIVLAAKQSTGATWTSSSQNAGHAFIEVGDLLGADWDSSRDWEFAIEFKDDVWENGNDAIRFGLWIPGAVPHSSSSARCRLVDKGNHGGSTITVRVQTDAGTVGSLGTDYTAVKAIGLKLDAQGVGQVLAGTSLDTLDTVAVFTTETSTLNPMLLASARLVIALITASDASPTTTVTVTKLRVRAF